MPRARSTPPRGSTLLLVTILLLVITIIGVAAVRLGTAERVNASAKGKRDLLVACANAARIQLWTEISRKGTGYLQSNDTPGEVVLADGTRLVSPAAPTWSVRDGGTAVQLVELTPMLTTMGAVMGDITNSMADPRSVNNSQAYRIIARCKDPLDRELFVEFTTKFALN